jgi:hypothetical protein
MARHPVQTIVDEVRARVGEAIAAAELALQGVELFLA